MLGYEYLNPGEGMRVMVLHDGVNAKPDLLGRGKELAAGPESWGVVESGTAVTRTRRRSRLGLAMRWVVSMVLLVCVALAVVRRVGRARAGVAEVSVGTKGHGCCDAADIG